MTAQIAPLTFVTVDRHEWYNRGGHLRFPHLGGGGASAMTVFDFSLCQGGGGLRLDHVTTPFNASHTMLQLVEGPTHCCYGATTPGVPAWNPATFHFAWCVTPFLSGTRSVKGATGLTGVPVMFTVVHLLVVR